MDVLKKVPVREQAPDVRNKNFDEVCLGYNIDEAKEEAERCLNCKNAQCIKGCPVSINIPGFIAQVKEGNIEEAYNNGKDYEARANMLKGSYWAGCAFTRAYVGYVHAIAHNLGGLYGTPHGLANAVILPYVLEWYGDCIYPQLAKLADIVGITGSSEAEKAQAFIAAIKKLNADMNIPSTFDFIKEEDLPTLIGRALKEGNPGYPVPRIMDYNDMESVIRRFMA